MTTIEVIRGTCGTCKAFDRDADQPKAGMCRFNPPAASVLMVPQRNIITGQTGMGPQTVSVWPPVPEDGWCRQWQPRLNLES